MFLFFIIVCCYVVNNCGLVGLGIFMQFIQDVVVDDTLQSLVSMHHPMNMLNIEAIIHLGQFTFYLINIIVEAVSR